MQREREGPQLGGATQTPQALSVLNGTFVEWN